METSNIPIMIEINNLKKFLKSDKNIYSEKFSEINNSLLYWFIINIFMVVQFCQK